MSLYLTVAWQSFSTTQQRVLSVIAARTVKLNSTEASRRFGLVKSGSGTRQAVDQLNRNGHIMATKESETGWRPVDPLLDLWLRNGRRWPIGLLGE